MTDIVEKLRRKVFHGPTMEAAHTRTVEWQAADEIERLREEAEFNYMAGYDSAKDDYRDMLQEAEEKIERLRAALRLAVMSDTEYCAELERINKALLEAPTVDIDVVVPERDYSQMTPKDCYEAGLLDGVFQAREAIKGAARAALETPTASAAENTDDR